MKIAEKEKEEKKSKPRPHSASYPRIAANRLNSAVHNVVPDTTSS
jgi:hypothetical protein